MNIVTDTWLTLGAKYGVAIVSIHHPVKFALKASSIIEQLRGTGDIGAAVRHAVGVAKDAKDENLLHLATDGNSAYQPEPFDVNVIDDVNAQGKPTIGLEAALNPVRVAIETRIRERLITAHMSTRQIRTACQGIDGCRNGLVDDIIRYLDSANVIRRLAGSGPWKLT
jgi:hypothetical protein